MNNNTEYETAIDHAKANAGKYLTFVLNRESYGIPVMKVREIINLVTITAVPQMPAHIKGVINLRGKIIPIMDMRLKFGLDDNGGASRACVIVVQVASSMRGTISVGLIVDAVEEVSHIAPEDIEESPEFGRSIGTSCLVGMAKIKGRVISLLDIDCVIGSDAGEALRESAV